MRYDPAVALVVVDVQNDFAHPSGALAVTGAGAVVDAVNAEVVTARTAGSLVVFTQDWHPARTPHFVTDGGPWPVHCVRGTWGAAFHAGLVVNGPVVRKGVDGQDGYSGFTVRDAGGGTAPTGLEGLLRERGVRAVVVVGLATDYCVKATALDAVALGFAVTVLRHAVAAVDVQPGDGDAALAELVAAGVVVE